MAEGGGEGRQSRVCQSHGLVAAPDGLCVLCRRRAEPERRRMPAAVIATAVIGTAALVVLAVVVPGSREQARMEVPADVPLVPGGVAPSGASQGVAATPRPLPVPVPVGLPAPSGAADAGARVDAAPTPPAPVASATAAPIGLTDAERAARDQRWRAEELRVARRRVSITMYVTQWCPHCRRAREWMQSEGISFVERDIETSDAYRARLTELNPRRSTPTFDIDGTVVVGFAPSRVARAIDQAAERHMTR